MKPIAHLSPARSRSRLLSPCSQDLKHGIQTENVGVHSKAGDEALSHVRQDAVDAALCNIADVNLYIGQAGPLNAIFQCKAGISEACRIHHQSLKALIYGLIDTIDRFRIESVAMLPGVRL